MKMTGSQYDKPRNNAIRSGVRYGSVALLMALLLSTTEVYAAAPTVRIKTVIAGEEYASPPGGQEWLSGHNYRDLWTTPIEVEVLDLGTFAGGLTPVMRVGGFQSAGLALKGNDGRDYTFRSINKTYSDAVIPEAFRGTFVEDVIGDQISGHFPAAQLVTSPIEEAVGVLGLPDAKIVVMPDDPALGEFRESFAGVLGLIIEFPQPVSDTNPGFHGATEILGQNDFWQKRQAGPEGFPDSRAYLRARLLDLFLNDWDRHDGNWRWGRIPGKPLLQPLPEDRDQVFSTFEGASLDFARLQGAPFVKFGDEYEPFHRLLHNGWDVDRYILADVEKDEWMAIARDVQSRLSNEVIGTGLRRLPTEYYELRGSEIDAILRKRRDQLVTMAEEYYAFHANTVDIHATDASEVVTIEATGDKDLLVSIATTQDGTANRPYYRRTFHTEETSEIRIFLHGGSDTVVTKGKRVRGLKIRIVGDVGSNTINDSGNFRMTVYGSERTSRLVGDNSSKLNTKPFEIPPRRSPNDVEGVAPRDWGSFAKPVFVGSYHRDPGLVLGAGIDYKRYGFRNYPWASHQVLKGGWGLGANSGFVDYMGKFRVENSKHGFKLKARYSGLDYLRFHGFGNETPYDEDNDDLYQISTDQFTLYPSLFLRLDEKMSFEIGPIAKYTDSSDTDLDTILEQLQPLGSDKFGQLGLTAQWILDTRGPQTMLEPGWLAEVAGAHYFDTWDAEDSFGYIEARIGRWFRLSEPLLASLNVRAKTVWGDYPYFESAFIGGDAYPIGTRWNRWAGDSSLGVLGSLRWTLMKMKGIFPGNLGVFGVANAARVFVDGENSSKWHPSYAGGLVLTTFDHTSAIHLGFGYSPDSGTFIMLRGSFSLPSLF